MTAITSGVQVNWASVLFKAMSEMVQKKSSACFVVQINKLLKYVGFSFIDDKEGTVTTMIDAESVVALRPKASVSEFIEVKKEIGVQHEATQKHKRTKRKLISVVSDLENTFFEESSAQTQPPPKTNPAKNKTKTTSQENRSYI